jgi:hypothetical protein
MNKFATAMLDTGTTTTTENGDKAYKTSLNFCVDFFFQAGAIRGAKRDRVWSLFSAAYGEDADLATRIALWARDREKGAGERQVFKQILEYLSVHDFDRLQRVAARVPDLGRWDDLFSILDSERGKKLAFQMFSNALMVEKNGLCAKWMPRDVGNKRKFKKDGEIVVKNYPPARIALNKIAKDLADFMGLSPKEYRQMLSKLTKVVESQMCARQWDKINYEHVPSVASARYGKAFKRHDEARYVEYLEAAQKGEKKINTAVLYPYDVTKKGVDDKAADTLWNNLPDYVPADLSFLPMIDVSGSMQSAAGGAGAWRGATSCLDVAVSLGLYLAERNKSAFERLALTFNGNPRFFQIPKGTVRQKVDFIHRSDNQMAANTNLDKAFNMILSVAVNNNVPQKDLPTHLIILSDMEFDSGWGNKSTSVAERTKAAFRAAGYELPNIVWWNIQSRNGNFPVRAGEDGMALVSGFSPSIMTSLLRGEMNPISQMLATVNVERYNH